MPQIVSAWCFSSLSRSSLQQENGWSWRRRRTWTLLETPGTVPSSADMDYHPIIIWAQFDSPIFHPPGPGRLRKGRRDKPTRRQMVSVYALFCFPVVSSVGPCTDTKVRLWAKPAVTHFSWQVSESSRCWNGHSTKTALWWWSSFVPLWDATLWSFLQVNSIFFFFLKWIPQTSLQLFIVSPEFHQKKPSSLNFLCGKVLISSLKTILHFIPLLT